MENTCKNCKHWEAIKEYPGDGVCTNNGAFKSLSEVSTDADFFCKYFESKNEELKIDTENCIKRYINP